jgi:Flp pilus assembly pilin Flp
MGTPALARRHREMTAMTLTLLKRLFRDEDGQDLIEYALLATFVSLVAIAGAQALGTALDGWYNAVAGQVDDAAAAAGAAGGGGAP